MSMALFNLVSTFSPPSIIQYFLPACSCGGTGYSKCPSSVFVWLFVQGCGRGSSARRAQTVEPSWGRNTPKWWWCTEQVKREKKKTKTGCRGLHFQPANKCTEKQSSSKMCWTSARSNLPPFLVSTRYLMINLTRFSYSTYRLKAATGLGEFLLWQQCSRSLYDTFFWLMLSSNIMSYLCLMPYLWIDSCQESISNAKVAFCLFWFSPKSVVLSCLFWLT